MRRLAWLWVAVLALLAGALPAGAASVEVFATLPGDSAYGLAVSPSGLVYVGEAGPRRSAEIYVLRPSGLLDETITVSAGPTGVVSLRGMAFDRAGSLYVADLATGMTGRGRILRVSPAGRVSVFATGLTAPVGVAVDRSDVVYVSDGLNGAIHWIGQYGASAVFAEDERLRPRLRREYGASGLALSPEGDALYISNRADDRVLKLSINRDGSAGRLLTLADAAQLSPRPRSGGALAGPDGLAIDARGNLLVAAARGGEVDMISPDGRLLARVELDDQTGDAPSAVAVAGRYVLAAHLSAGSIPRVLRLPLLGD